MFEVYSYQFVTAKRLCRTSCSTFKEQDLYCICKMFNIILDIHIHYMIIQYTCTLFVQRCKLPN